MMMEATSSHHDDHNVDDDDDDGHLIWWLRIREADPLHRALQQRREDHMPASPVWYSCLLQNIYKSKTSSIDPNFHFLSTWLCENARVATTWEAAAAGLTMSSSPTSSGSTTSIWKKIKFTGFKRNIYLHRIRIRALHSSHNHSLQTWSPKDQKITWFCLWGDSDQWRSQEDLPALEIEIQMMCAAGSYYFRDGNWEKCLKSSP